MSRIRQRAKGRRGGESEHFARVPVSVLESEACTTLHHAAFKILVILASQYRGNNNGALALTEHYARRFGLRGRDTLYRSLAELLRRGLLVRTRRGIKSKRLFSLYAVGWARVDNLNGEPLQNSVAAVDVINAYGERAVDWRTWTASRPTIGNDGTEIHTDRRESVFLNVGNDGAISRPISSTENPISDR